MKTRNTHRRLRADPIRCAPTVDRFSICFPFVLPAILACLLALAGPAFALTSVATDPVGFTTSSLVGNSDTYLSFPFARPFAFAGVVSSISGNVITVAGTPGWTTNRFVYAYGTQPNHYYALIGSAASTDPKEGHTYAVTANGSNTLTVDTAHDDLAGLTANGTISNTDVAAVKAQVGTSLP